MTIPLSRELERFVQSEVESGHFASREAVIEAALWDMQQRRAAIQEGFYDLNAGRVRPAADVFAELRVQDAN